MPYANPTHIDLQAITKKVMIARGFRPDFPPEVQKQLAALRNRPPKMAAEGDVRDLRNLLWSSIDNDTSRDLDQVEVAERLPDGGVKIMIGIADVDAFVPKLTPIDQHAARETTTVYAGVRNFPMLPEELSTGQTSLLEDQDQYNSLGAWLQSNTPAPPKVAASADLQAQLRLQDEVAQKLKDQRHRNGALSLQTDELRPLVVNEEVVDVVKQQKNRATELIEDFMVAANGVVARFLEDVSSLRRIVRTPERWDRIIQLAAIKGTTLPAQPDSKALNDFLLKQNASDPDHFADLSLAVIKLIGPGEYVLERAGEPAPGHFGLAVQDYTHSTAPNRRFADVVTQRLIKAKLAGQRNVYSESELSAIAANCTEKEDAARKVEREMTKRLAAIAMQRRIGEVFDAVVTGAKPHGTFVRALQAHVEGLLVQGGDGLDVGDKLRVKLVRTDIEKGYIDFARA